MDISLNQLIQFHLNNTLNLDSLLNYTNYFVLYPQNGDRIVNIDYVTSFHPVYCNRLCRPFVSNLTFEPTEL